MPHLAHGNPVLLGNMTYRLSKLFAPFLPYVTDTIYREMGERACAYVIPKAGQEFTFKEMVDFLKSRNIAMFKLPERLEIVTDFPTVGDSGKVNKEILKKEIREKVAAEGKS